MMSIRKMRESDIRPPNLLRNYLELCRKDAVAYFGSGKREEIPCPACNSSQVLHAFEKWSFGYVVCDKCSTLYQSPRPSRESFARFYKDSPSARYWAETFFPVVAETRRLSLFRPKVEEIAKLCLEDGFAPSTVIDIGAGWGLLLEEWRRSFPETELIAVEPNPDLARICRSKAFKVAECFAEEAGELAGHADLAIALEVIEHVQEPLTFCRSLKKLLRKSGKILLTGLTVDGFDIQVLWNRSKAVSPPHHINFISIAGYRLLLERAGFSKIRLFTPGKLDVDIVKTAYSENPDLFTGHRFFSHLMTRDEDVLQAFQLFLSENRLSSHCWIWATR